MNKSNAEKIRARYAAGNSVAAIAEEFGTSAAVAYSIIKNQSWHDRDYQPPVRPREVLDDVGVFQISQLRSEGKSWDRISRKLEQETGNFVRGETIRDWFNRSNAYRLLRGVGR